MYRLDRYVQTCLRWWWLFKTIWLKQSIANDAVVWHSSMHSILAPNVPANGQLLRWSAKNETGFLPAKHFHGLHFGCDWKWTVAPWQFFWISKFSWFSGISVLQPVEGWKNNPTCARSRPERPQSCTAGSSMQSCDLAWNLDLGLSENVVYPMAQWFCWSLSLLNGYFFGGIPHFQTYPFGGKNIMRYSILGSKNGGNLPKLASEWRVMKNPVGLVSQHFTQSIWNHAEKLRPSHWQCENIGVL